MSYTGNNIPTNINGIEYGWNSITVSIEGLIINGITTINYGSTQTADNIYGRGGKPVAKGLGNREFSASMTIHKSEYFALLASAKAKGYNSILDFPMFDVTVIYQPLVGVAVFKKDVIKGNLFLTENAEASQGDTALVVTLDMLPSDIELG